MASKKQETISLCGGVKEPHVTPLTKKEIEMIKARDKKAKKSVKKG